MPASHVRHQSSGMAAGGCFSSSSVDPRRAGKHALVEVDYPELVEGIQESPRIAWERVPV